MLIWKGHGILILVFGILGALLTGMAWAAGYAATHWEWMLRMLKPANAWGVVLGIWLYGRTIGKTVIKTYIDPATHQQVTIKKSHTLFFLSPMIWAVVTGLMACVVTVESFNKPTDELLSELKSGGSSPASAAFTEANNLIDMDKGKTAYGNTPDAEKLAAAFSEMVMMGREMGVQKTKKKPTISLSHGKFLSYCRINPDSCVFMVHVPDLRKFTEDAKRYMVEMAWTVASLQAAELKPRPKRVAVGVRGAFLYDEVVEGPVTDAAVQAATASDENWAAGIEQRFSGSDSKKRLETYFEPHAAGAVLPVLDQADEPETKAADAAPQKATTEIMPSAAKPAKAPQGKLEVLLDWFPTLNAGKVAGNTDSMNQVALKYAGFVHDRVSLNPALGGMALPEPSFSVYIHLRDDTVAFLLAVPAGAGLPEAAFKVIQTEAWLAAATVASQMSPLPVRIAVITFNEGAMDMTRTGSPRNKQGTDWIVEQEQLGTEGKDLLAPFVAASSKPLMTVKSPLTLQNPVNSVMAADRHVKAAAPAAAPVMAAPAPAPAPAAAPAPSPATAPLLPTPVRDWKDTSGRVMQASLESFTTPAKDVGRFKRADGQAFEVPFSRLSAEDQEFIRGIAAQSKAAP